MDENDEKLDEKARMRNAVINELINTERDYIKDVAYILEELKEPLESKGIINALESGRIFSNLSSLLGINRELLGRLEQAQGHGIGVIFVEMSPYLKMYSIYCANQDTR